VFVSHTLQHTYLQQGARAKAGLYNFQKMHGRVRESRRSSVDVCVAVCVLVRVRAGWPLQLSKTVCMGVFVSRDVVLQCVRCSACVCS